MYLQLFLLFNVALINALPSGAPPTVCSSMLPFHGGGIGRQTRSSPFTTSAWRTGQSITVKIGSELNLPFQGFMLQARDNSENPVGYFEANSDVFHTIDCKQSGDALTHSDTVKKSAVEVLWHSNGFEGIVTFNATIAQDYATFWTGVQSQQLEVSNGLTYGIDTPRVPVGRVSSTTPPNFFPDVKKEAATEFDPFYDGCGTKKSCFGAPSGCTDSKNCKVVAAITVYGDRYEFELKAGSSAAWVGVGLSDDTQMGNDSVIECVREGGVIRAYLSTTVPRPNLNVVRDRKQDGIQLLSSSSNDGALYCRVVREAKTRINDRVYDLTKDKYNLVIGAGSSIHPNKVSFHDIAYVASGESRILSDVSVFKPASKLLLRLHGAFMLAAWIGTASLGIMLARYYRQTWVGKDICGKDLWFAWHRFFMVLTWALTVAGFVLIFVELKAWSTEKNPHAILGVVTTALCFLQPIGAFFRPHPGTSKRPVFNWIHWFLGNAAHIIAIVTIFFAVKLNKAELPDWVDWILVAYVAVQVVIHIVLSIMGCASEKSAEKRVNAFPMKDMSGSARSSIYMDSNADAPYSAVRKCLLAIYIIFIILFVAALIVIVVCAPIEEFWHNLMEKM